ncbi:MAG: EAL domain-containing protein [Acidimicrobiales bacterium]
MSMQLTSEEIARRWGALFEAVSHALVLQSPERKILYWNRGAESVFGWTAEEAIGRDTRYFLAAESVRSTGDVLREYVATGSSWSGELPVRHRHGTIVPVSASVTPFWDDAGDVVGQLWIGNVLPSRSPGGSGRDSRGRNRAAPERDDVLLTLDQTGDMVSVHSPEGGFLAVAGACQLLVGYEPKELVGTNIADYVHPDDVALFQMLSGVSILSDLAARTGAVRFRAKDSHYVWLEMAARAVRDERSGEVARVVRTARDVTPRRLAEDSSSTGQAIIGLDGTILQTNRALCEFLGRSEHEVLGVSVLDFSHPDDHDDMATNLQLLADGRQAAPPPERRYLRPDGSVVWGLINRWMVPGGTGRPVYAICQIIDITERKRQEAELAHLALHDSLTGLANRALFLDRLQHSLVQGSRRHACHGLLSIDLDAFNVVNAGHGYEVGDEVLRRVARRVEAEVRATDTVARLSADHFAVLLDDIAGPEEALRKARQMRDALAHGHVLPDGTEIFVTASIGVAFSSNHVTDAEQMLRAADRAGQSAREIGHGEVGLADPISKHNAARAATSTGLHHAIERDEMRLWYQPIVDLASRRAVGVEALLRWQHPDRGLVSPDEFIPIAEETGLIVPLGAWAIEQACLDASSFVVAGQQLGVSVNVSPRQIRGGGIVEVVQNALNAASLQPGVICLEITESLLTGDTAASLATLGELSELGVRIAIDDFGTGYSSLSYLKLLPATQLKIDRVFVAGLPTNESDAALTRAMVSMAHALGIAVVAEGVETEDQLRELSGLGCEMAQGFLFARPRPIEETLATIAALG